MYSLFETTFTEEIYLTKPHVTVVIPLAWAEIKTEERVLLAKILQAVKQSLDSVTIRHQPIFDLSVWPEKPEKVICFSPTHGLPKFEVLSAQNCNVVVSTPLPELLMQDDAKKKLWAGLKQLFS